ncbi:hypothetical protein [Stieleria varia]|uniref:Uncharacterized protein n=1 Tax=Stieleria varia TaxID=2528005 RepID=A0A5C6AXD4_9BACT|nr:hypothetical protein [Stieleria varia]TWU04288.1 hypothetical protein Pla52n_23270 [Stieleria varia]
MKFDSVLVCCFLLVFCYPVFAADDISISQSRIYGPLFVAPVQVGSHPPVCVRKTVSGQLASIKLERNPGAPWVAVICKELEHEMPALLKAFQTAESLKNVPCRVTVTPEKGILPENLSDNVTYNTDAYFTPQQALDKRESLRQYAKEHSLSEMYIGIAVNPLWRSGAGYTDDNDVIVAYVRGKVVTVLQLQSAGLTIEGIHDAVEKIAASHQESQQ